MVGFRASFFERGFDAEVSVGDERVVRRHRRSERHRCGAVGVTDGEECGGDRRGREGGRTKIPQRAERVCAD